MRRLSLEEINDKIMAILQVLAGIAAIVVFVILAGVVIFSSKRLLNDNGSRERLTQDQPGIEYTNGLAKGQVCLCRCPCVRESPETKEINAEE